MRLCSMSNLALLIAIMLLQINMTSAKAQPTQPQPWQPQEFPIGFCCGPPEPFITLERYREIKAAGFTHVTPPCGPTTVETNRHILGLCAIVGLKAFMTDARMPLLITGEPNARERLEAIVKDYRGYSALEGYFITDEPSAAAFKGLGEVVAYLRQLDPAHQAYINLLPNYANAEQLGTPTYEQHVRQFAQTVQPFVLSYDHYHFLTGGERPLFFKNLDTMRQAAGEFHIPFWQIVLCVQHGPYRNLTEGELSYEAMQTLVYGGKGLFWFTYWQPDDPAFVWQHAMINRDGSHDPHYAMVQRVNSALQALGTELLRADSEMVFQTGTIPPGGTPRPATAPLDIIGNSNLSIGLFDDHKRHTLALITNTNYSHETTATVQIVGHKKLWQFDALTRKWSRLHDAKAQPNGTTAISLRLSASGAALLRW